MGEAEELAKILEEVHFDARVLICSSVHQKTLTNIMERPDETG